jgi:hypothetical protein
MKRSIYLLVFSLLLLSTWMVGCGDDEVIGPEMGVLTLSFSGLQDLGAGYAYEGWIIVGGNAISTGTFTVDGSGNLSNSTFQLTKSDLDAATKFILTIEPSPDSDPAPASTHYLAGTFTSPAAALTVGDADALGDDFTSAIGSYILETPSTSSVPADYANGIWWLDPAAGPGPSLTLPTLPAGWVYEGWVVDPVGGPITTGTFTEVDTTDSDGAGPTAGMDPTPPFPGQDFITPPISLIGFAAVISIEPYPDNSTAPFTLKPLVDMNVEDVGAGILQSMANDAMSFPTGTATR